jgi:hypothetical protein
MTINDLRLRLKIYWEDGCKSRDRSKMRRSTIAAGILSWFPNDMELDEFQEQLKLFKRKGLGIAVRNTLETMCQECINEQNNLQ